MKKYRIAKRILAYKEKNNLSYRKLGEMLGCEGSSLHYLLTKSKESLAFQAVDKFEILEKRAALEPVVEDEAWDE